MQVGRSEPQFGQCVRTPSLDGGARVIIIVDDIFLCDMTKVVGSGTVGRM